MYNELSIHDRSWYKTEGHMIIAVRGSGIKNDRRINSLYAPTQLQCIVFLIHEL